MDTPKLIEFTNAQRFKPSKYKCPQCQGETLMDEWPSNYCGGKFTDEGSEDGCNIKHVCLKCNIAFRVATFTYTGSLVDPSRDVPITELHGMPYQAGHNYFDIVPLIERDGHLLTPHDVRCYKYHDEHGTWPSESYG